MKKHNLKMKIIAASSILGASLVPMSSALSQEAPVVNYSVTDSITVNASYNIIAAPLVVGIEQDTVDLPFGDVTLHAIDDVTKVATPVTATIQNGTDTTNYTLSVSAATCINNGVSIAPSVSYNAGTAVVADGSSTIAYADATAAISIGGTLTATKDAASGESTCSFTVTLASV